MDPIAHTFTGAALASAGLRRVTPLATATLVLAANAPDVDIVTQFAGPYISLAHRRGVTHGVFALALWPFVITGVMLLWDRWVRRRQEPEAPPLLVRPTLLLAAIGVVSHPALDWLNTYGMRWLLPFDGRWTYGDAVFIIDPWIWLALGGALFLQHSARPVALAAWGTFAAAASLLVITTPFVPTEAKVAWTVAVLALVGLRIRGRATRLGATNRAQAGEPRTRVVLVATALYIGLMVGSTAAAESEVRRVLLQEGDPAGDVMAGPAPANPFARHIVAEVASGFRSGDFHWLRTPRARVDPTVFERGTGGPIVAAAALEPDAQRFLVWSRFPTARVRETETGYEVRIGDARTLAGMGSGPLAGITVHLDHDLRLVAGDPSTRPTSPAQSPDSIAYVAPYRRHDDEPLSPAPPEPTAPH